MSQGVEVSSTEPLGPSLLNLALVKTYSGHWQNKARFFSKMERTEMASGLTLSGGLFPLETS